MFSSKFWHFVKHFVFQIFLNFWRENYILNFLFVFLFIIFVRFGEFPPPVKPLISLLYCAQVYDGPKAISTYLLEPTCAVPSDLQLPLSYYSSYRTVDVYFETDSYDEFRGFSVDYRAIEGNRRIGGPHQLTPP